MYWILLNFDSWLHANNALKEQRGENPMPPWCDQFSMYGWHRLISGKRSLVKKWHVVGMQEVRI